MKTFFASVLLILFLPFLLFGLLIWALTLPFQYLKYKCSAYYKNFGEPFSIVKIYSTAYTVYNALAASGMPLIFVNETENAPAHVLHENTAVILDFCETLYFGEDTGTWMVKSVEGHDEICTPLDTYMAEEIAAVGLGAREVKFLVNGECFSEEDVDKAYASGRFIIYHHGEEVTDVLKAALLSKKAQKPLLIFDTDMDTDCDDAGALGLLLNYVKAGKADLLGIIADAPAADVAPCCEAICDYYGVPVEIGAIYEKTYANDPRFADYRAHRAGVAADKYYNAAFAARVGKKDTDYTPAARAYREMLAGEEDNSVTVVAVGLLTALAELFETTGDDLSPLSGVELFAKKVKCVVSMGNATYPEFRDKNFNYKMDREGAKVFFDNCPVPVYVCPEGSFVVTGHSFSETFEKDHPLRVAYEMWCGGESKGRSSWDLITLLFALEPQSPLFKAETHGTVRYDTTNRAWWEEDGIRTDYDLRITVSEKEMAEILEKSVTKM